MSTLAYLSSPRACRKLQMPEDRVLSRQQRRISIVCRQVGGHDLRGFRCSTPSNRTREKLRGAQSTGVWTYFGRLSLASAGRARTHLALSCCLGNANAFSTDEDQGLRMRGRGCRCRLDYIPSARESSQSKTSVAWYDSLSFSGCGRYICRAQLVG